MVYLKQLQQPNKIDEWELNTIYIKGLTQINHSQLWCDIIRELLGTPVAGCHIVELVEGWWIWGLWEECEDRQFRGGCRVCHHHPMSVRVSGEVVLTRDRVDLSPSWRGSSPGGARRVPGHSDGPWWSPPRTGRGCCLPHGSSGLEELSDLDVVKTKVLIIDMIMSLYMIITIINEAHKKYQSVVICIKWMLNKWVPFIP